MLANELNLVVLGLPPMPPMSCSRLSLQWPFPKKKRTKPMNFLFGVLVEVLFCESDGRVLGGMRFRVLVEALFCMAGC